MNFYLIDMERTLKTKEVCYWKANYSGYTFDKEEAGIYPKEIALRCCLDDFNNETLMLPVK